MREQAPGEDPGVQDDADDSEYSPRRVAQQLEPAYGLIVADERAWVNDRRGRARKNRGQAM
jgi:hypothetical protein